MVIAKTKHAKNPRLLFTRWIFFTRSTPTLCGRLPDVVRAWRVLMACSITLYNAHSAIHPLAHSPTRLLTCPCASGVRHYTVQRPFATQQLAHSPTRPLIHSPTPHSLNRPLVRSPIAHSPAYMRLAVRASNQTDEIATLARINNACWNQLNFSIYFFRTLERLTCSTLIEIAPINC